jgi:hypothetical protein
LRIIEDSRGTHGLFAVVMDVSDIVPYSEYRLMDTIFPKLGLVIKRQFGYIGFDWGYGRMTTVHHPDAYPEVTAPVGLNIHFQRELTDDFLKEHEKGFKRIYRYLERDWRIYKGIDEDDYE